MNDLWAWLSDSIEHFRETGDRERFQIASLYGQGARQMHDNPTEALELLAQARRLAERFGEPWWMLFCDHWRCQTLLFHTGDVGQALHLATEAISVADQDPAFAGFPQRVCLHDDQISALSMIDPRGYAAEIEAGCAYIEREGPALEGCQHCKRTMRIDLLIAQDRFDQAEAAALEALKDCGSETAAHYTSQYYATLCQIAAHRQDWRALETWARSGALFHGRMGSPQSNVELMMWHALALHELGEAERSKTAHRLARSAQRSRGDRQTPGCYHALARYYEATGKLRLALVARRIELRTMSGAPYLQCRCRLERIRLLLALGRDTQDDADAVIADAHRLRDPEAVLARLRAMTETL